MHYNMLQNILNHKHSNMKKKGIQAQEFTTAKNKNVDFSTG